MIGPWRVVVLPTLIGLNRFGGAFWEILSFLAFLHSFWTFFLTFEKTSENGQWTYFYRYQTRRCPARTRWQDHQAIRAARLQTCGNEIVPTWQGAPREALRGPQGQGERFDAEFSKITFPTRASSMDSSSTWTLVQSAPWSGRARTSSKWAAWCSARPTHRPLFQVTSVLPQYDFWTLFLSSHF